jgi:hypothetical protein
MTASKGAGRGSNLVPYRFKPGHSGNPAGRVKFSITEKLKEYLEMPMIELVELAERFKNDPSSFTGKEFMAMRMVHSAIMANDLRYIVLIIERIEGKAVQPVDLGDEEKIDEIENVLRGITNLNANRK